GGYAINVYSTQKQLPVVQQTHRVSAPPIADNHCAFATLEATVVKRNLPRIRALDPCLEGEILQLETRRISQIHPVVAGAIKHKRLAANAGRVSYPACSRIRPWVSPGRVRG